MTYEKFLKERTQDELGKNKHFSLDGNSTLAMANKGVLSTASYSCKRLYGDVKVAFWKNPLDLDVRDIATLIIFPVLIPIVVLLRTWRSYTECRKEMREEYAKEINNK